MNSDKFFKLYLILVYGIIESMKRNNKNRNKNGKEKVKKDLTLKRVYVIIHSLKQNKTKRNQTMNNVTEIKNLFNSHSYELARFILSNDLLETVTECNMNPDGEYYDISTNDVNDMADLIEFKVTHDNVREVLYPTLAMAFMEALEGDIFDCKPIKTITKLGKIDLKEIEDKLIIKIGAKPFYIIPEASLYKLGENTYILYMGCQTNNSYIISL